jgi:hypothetical protein
MFLLVPAADGAQKRREAQCHPERVWWLHDDSELRLNCHDCLFL